MKTESLKRIFLDFNATNVPDPEVWAAVRQLPSLPLNPSSVHAYGQQARRMVTEFSEAIAELLGVHPLDLIFTSGATEANHLGVLGRLAELESRKAEGALYFSCTGHPSLTKLKTLCEARGFLVRFLPVASIERPMLDVDFVRRSFEKHQPLLVAWEWANNETGVIQPMTELYALAQRYQAAVHVDAVQVFGRIAVDLKKFPEASFAFSGHKYGGLGGHGLLIKPRDAHLQPLFVGGSQQNGMRAGTVSLTLVKAQQVCMQRYYAAGPRRCEHTLQLQKMLELQLSQIFDHEHPGEILGATVDRLPNTTLFRLIGVSAETLMMFMDLRGVMISTGSACSSGSIDPSAALVQMGMDGMAAAEFVRVSTSEHTRAEDIERFVHHLKAFIQTCH